MGGASKQIGAARFSQSRQKYRRVSEDSARPRIWKKDAIKLRRQTRQAKALSARPRKARNPDRGKSTVLISFAKPPLAAGMPQCAVVDRLLRQNLEQLQFNRLRFCPLRENGLACKKNPRLARKPLWVDC